MKKTTILNPKFHTYTLDNIHEILLINKAVMLYFSTTSCSVGENLEPKVIQLVQNEFPLVHYQSIDMNENQLVSAHFNVFAEPTVVVFFEGKETIRKSRNFGMHELEDAIKRPYQLIFE